MGRCMASEPCGLTTFASEPAPSLFIISNSCVWPIWTTDQKEENMQIVAQAAIIGIDVSRDWLDIHCLPDGQRQRLPNTENGHARETRHWWWATVAQACDVPSRSRCEPSQSGTQILRRSPSRRSGTAQGRHHDHCTKTPTRSSNRNKNGPLTAHEKYTC